MTATVPAGRAADHFDYLEDPTPDTAQAAVLEAWAAEVRSATFQLLAQKSAVDSPDQAPQYRARLEGALAARTVMLRALVHGAPAGIPTAVLADAREALGDRTRERADAIDLEQLESAVRAELVPAFRRVCPTRIGFDPREGSRCQCSLAADEGSERREDRGEVATAPADSLHPLFGTSAELGEEVGSRGVIAGVDPHSGMRHFDEALVHEASPSAGDGAEPVLASTLSVEAGQGARGSNGRVPEEPIITALRDATEALEQAVDGMNKHNGGRGLHLWHQGNVWGLREALRRLSELGPSSRLARLNTEWHRADATVAAAWLYLTDDDQD